MKKILVILGPTAAGKTDLALYLAKKFNGELIACDSRQVYKGLDIGTGKLPSGRWNIEDGRWRKGKAWWEMDGIRIWMYDVVDPKKQYTVANYVKDAEEVIGEINDRGNLPIIVGGTGLYLKALFEGLPNLAVPIDKKLRKELEKLTLLELQEKLKKLTLAKWEKLNSSDRQNPRRLIRSIEIVSVYGHMKTMEMRKGLRENYKVLKIGLTASREILYQRIDERVISRIKQGMIEEVKKLRSSGLFFKRMKQLGLEYGVLADYLQGKFDKAHLIKIMQGKIHGFARRQLTWFKKEKQVNWFNIKDRDFPDNVEKKISKWYYLW